MKIFLSNVPNFILTKELGRDSVKKWIYFGTNDSVLKKLEAGLGACGEQINYGQKLHEITRIQRHQFILWIDQIAASFFDRKEWLFSVSAVKNTCTSNLFLYTCYLFVLEDFIRERKQIDVVFVDSPALAGVFKNHFPESIALASINSWLAVGFYFNVFVKSVLRFGKYLLEFSRKFWAAKVVLGDRSQELLQEKDNIVLIRNFITGQFSDTQDDILESHYFPGLYDYLKNKNYTPVFLPVAIRTTSYRRLYLKVLKSKKVIIFPEEFLRLQDYFYAFSMPFRALSLRLVSPPYGRYQLGRLLDEDYRTNLTEFGFLYAVLLSCLGKRFKEHGLAVKGIINWMENQALEKGLIKGFRENFLDVQVIGSQPFFSLENYFSTVSSDQEKQSGLLPERILVLGPAGKKWATEFINDVPVAYSPAFRYASVLLEPLLGNRQANNLLVLLSIRFEDSLNIMRTLLKIAPHLESFDRIMIKLHPAGNFDQKKLAKAIGEDFPSRYEFVDGKLEQYINKVSVGFCGASSTAAELVMRGIPVIAMGDSHALTMDCLYCKQDSDIWQLCFSCDQVIEALNHFKTITKEKSQELLQKAHEFRRIFIAQPSEQYWENYLVGTINV